MMKRFKIFPGKLRTALLFSCVFLATLAGLPMPSHALLLVQEMVYIGPKAGAATFKVKNTTMRPEAYRMEWVDLKMIPGGRKRKIEPGEVVPTLMPAEPYMYISPRRLMLMPEQLQHLRLMVRRPSDLPPGEYRSYMVFNPEPVPKEYAPGSQGESAGSKTSVNVDILTGFRVPVFFLHGETTLKTSIVNARYGVNEKGKPGVHFTFVREGTRSAIGRIEINCMAQDSVQKISEGRIQVFTELGSLDYFLPTKEIPPGCTTATLDYIPHPEDPDYTGSFVRMAEVLLQ